MTKDGFCGVMCSEGYLADRAHGAIYGPYKLGDKFVSGREFHAATGTCRYCNARPLGRSRKGRRGV